MWTRCSLFWVWLAAPACSVEQLNPLSGDALIAGDATSGDDERGDAFETGDSLGDAVSQGDRNRGDTLPGDVLPLGDSSPQCPEYVAGGGGSALAGMTRVPAGPFTMGCDGCVHWPGTLQVDEQPEHTVLLSAFDIDLTEVTHAAYNDCVSAQACTEPHSGFDPTGRADYPVTSVTWAQALEYCTWREGRLPTEAEWEKAARGTDGRTFPWGENDPACHLANIDGCVGDHLPVGSLPLGASPYGALDMAGNAWEWVADWYAEDAYQQHDCPNPTGPASGENRGYRGGSYGNLGELARASNRAATYNPDFGGSGLGFRCARTAP